MTIMFKIPGWLARHMVIRDLKVRPWLMGMGSSRCEDFGVLQVRTANYYDQSTIDYITDGAAAAGCDALTFVRTVKQFRSIVIKLDLKMGMK